MSQYSIDTVAPATKRIAGFFLFPKLSVQSSMPFVLIIFSFISVFLCLQLIIISPKINIQSSFFFIYQCLTVMLVSFTMPANVILSADLAVIFFKYQTSSSSINRSSNGLLILLLKVSAMWTYLSVVLMLLCPISSFTILMSVPCSSKWVANEWRSRCG